MSQPVRVLIVDDSALMRQMLATILSADPGIQVVDTASDPYMAREKIRRHNPDVITLDVEMPRMNGLEFLEKIMALRPMPVVMISSLTDSGMTAAVQALELGAVDVIGKPAGFVTDGMAALAGEIVTKVKAAARSSVAPQPIAVAASRSGLQRFSPRSLICIGASTGGIPALTAVVCRMPLDAPPVVIVQHMPPGFTARLAARLDSRCLVHVVEAVDGALLKPGHVYVAPGGLMTRIRGDRLEVRPEDRINGFCPSVDALFDSAASHGADAVGILLTGMGQDGARGLLAMRRNGAFTIAQDAATCVVYGMPRAAMELDAAVTQLPVSKIAAAALDACCEMAGATQTERRRATPHA